MAKLYFYYSAMNAGKTTTLLQSSYNYNERGMRTLLFMASFDLRYGEKGKIISRIGLNSDAVTFDSEFSFYDFVEEEHKKERLHCILVDDAHFLTKDQVYGLSDIVDKLRIPVLTYGLRSDFLGEPFEASKHLLALAEELEEIKTICHCGRKATMNLRIDDQGNSVHQGKQIEVGGNDRYVSVCRIHFKEGKSGQIAKKETFPLRKKTP